MSFQRVRDLAKSVYLNSMRGLRADTAVRIDYARVFGRLPNLATPQTFSEAIQRQKVCERNYRIVNLVDKLRVKAHVADQIGSQWVIPTLWQGKHLTEAVLRSIPKAAVVKPNHASGLVAFIEEDADFAKLARRANAWLKIDYHLLHREWAYGCVDRHLLIEPKICDPRRIVDYKFWVFDGSIRLIQTDLSRFHGHTRQFYDPDWTRLDVEMNYPSVGAELPRPRSFAAMFAAAEKLAAGFRFVRVDLYDTSEGPRFGEMTFWPEAGLCRFAPRWFDRELGALLSGSSPRAMRPAAQAASSPDDDCPPTKPLCSSHEHDFAP